jgi:hypothetical protein
MQRYRLPTFLCHSGDMTNNAISTFRPIRQRRSFALLPSLHSLHSPDSLIFFSPEPGWATDPATHLLDKLAMTERKFSLPFIP